MAVRAFVVTLRHDRGRVALRVSAKDAASAVRTVLAAEGAPRSAVVSVKVASRRTNPGEGRHRGWHLEGSHGSTFAWDSKRDAAERLARSLRGYGMGARVVRGGLHGWALDRLRARVAKRGARRNAGEHVEHPCHYCGKELGPERFLGITHGRCVRILHARATGGRVSKGRVVWGGSRRRKNPSGEYDEQAARELELYGKNDSTLYRQEQSIIKNLMRKRAKGTYDHARSVDLWMYLAESAAKKYAAEFDDAKRWHEIFSVATRRAVAKEWADYFRAEAGYGNYDNWKSWK